jgi:hypothetical protein
MRLNRTQHTILEAYIKRLIESDVGSKLRDARESSWINATKELREHLQALKRIQELRLLAKKNNRNDPDGARKDFEKLKKGGTYDSTGRVVGYGDRVVISEPKSSLKSQINAWKIAAREWNEFDPIDVDNVYAVNNDSILSLYNSIPGIKTLAQNENIPNENDPFKDAFETSAPKNIISKGNRPTILRKQWVGWTNRIPFQRTEADYKIKAGPGERKLAAQLGANGPMGSGVSYDIEQNGFKYEVKAIDDNSTTIRGAAEGIKLFTRVSRKINDVFVQIKTFIDKYKQFFGDDAFTRRTEAFFAEEEEKFESGGISEERLRKFSAVIQSVSRRLRSLGGDPGPTDTKKISVNNKDYQVSKQTYQTILDLLGVNTANLDKKQMVEFLSSILKSSAFVDVDRFISEIEQDLRPSQMFANIVDGVFIVHPTNGYFYLSIPDIDKFFKFVSVSQGRPEYKFTGQMLQ